MRMYDIIKSKRDGRELSDEEIRFAVQGCTDGSIPDYQMSAFAMAVWFRGMSERETAALTRFMCESGDVIDLSRFGDRTVDKHSTGGVGDKTSVIVLPIVAACGGICAKMSGRGLGHTGGTIDKLEAFPGYNTKLDSKSFMKQVSDIGLALVGQTGNLTPADKKLYAIRDVTATVDSIPLIASSIMSKKLAAGARSIVLDVKTGSGAFAKTKDEALLLARTMAGIGRSFDRRVTAVITDMDTPLGCNIGNALELTEAVAVLRGGGPQDLRRLCTVLAADMLELSLGVDENKAARLAEAAIDDGRAFEKLCEWIEYQGSDRKYAENTELLPSAPNVIGVRAESGGYISRMDSEGIGVCACMLGAGRTVKDAPIDPGAGIVMTKKTGDKVRAGDVIAYLHTSLADASHAVRKYLSCIELSEHKPPERPLIIGTVKQSDL